MKLKIKNETLKAFIKMLDEEFYILLAKGLKPKLNEYKNFIEYHFKDSDGSELFIHIKIYKTSWYIRLETDYYKFASGVIIENRNRKDKITKYNELEKILSSKNKLEECLKRSIYEIIKHRINRSQNENYDCMRLSNSSLILINNQNKLIDKHLKHIKSKCDITKIIEVFFNIDESKTIHKFTKDLTLRIIADEIINFKYDLLGLNREKLILNSGATIKATSQKFAYAHVLQFYDGKCKWLHGHNGVISIKCNLDKNTMRLRPMLLSYGYLKSFLKTMDKHLDHKTLWSLNKENVYQELEFGNYRVDTPKQSIIFHDKEGHVLIPFDSENNSYSTSEMSLRNYIIPEFLVYMIRFLRNNGEDSTSLTINGFDEKLTYTFEWYETPETVCSFSINV